MDRTELSNLAFLIRALVANPSPETIAAARNSMFGGSATFLASIAVLEELTNRLAHQGLPNQILFERLEQEAIRLSRTQTPLERSVGEALVWALESAQSRQVNAR